MKKIILHALTNLSLTVNANADIHINAERLNSNLQQLSIFGAQPNKGTSRVAYSEADKQGREWIIPLMQKAGLNPYIDAAGNIVGNLQGKDESLKPIVSGSHIDTVPEGGNFDGIVGALSAIEVAQSLTDAHLQLKHSYKVIVFANEEGAHVGSRAITTGLSEEDLKFKSLSGKSVNDGIKFIGGNPDKLNEAKIKPGSVVAFIELHIEQGGILATQQKDIGIVEGIVGIKRWMMTFTGEQNHAGTTPMELRNDPVLGAAEFILKSHDVVANLKSRQVATVGKIDVEPNAPNVIPGKVTVSFETRDLAANNIANVEEKILAIAADIAKERNLTFSSQLVYDTPPIPTDKELEDVVETSAKEIGYSYLKLPSGAGHDAQEMAKVAPTAMLFIPSKKGISHHKDEFSSADEIAKGAEVLLQTIMRIDKRSI